jgi:hypothetical protein
MQVLLLRRPGCGARELYFSEDLQSSGFPVGYVTMYEMWDGGFPRI